MPDGVTLTAMMNAADALRLTEVPRTRCGGVPDSIPLHIAQYMPGGVSLTAISQFVGQKAGSVVCYENTLLNDALVGRIDAIAGNIIARQSVASCMRCHASYRQLVQNGPHTIVASSDDGYGGTPDNTIFLFAPTGLMFCRR